MPAGVPHTTRRAIALPAKLQPRFDALVARAGHMRAPALLGIGWPTIEKLRFGGHAAPESVARVVAFFDREDGDAA